jgi:two-component system cell cycle response regulator CtrA
MSEVAMLDRLRLENALLAERVAQLEAVLAPELAVPPGLGLTPSEERVLRVLVARPLASREALRAALYRDFGREAGSDTTIAVFVHRLRRKLAPAGIQIATSWGRGWSLAGEARARWRAGVTP